MPIEPFRKTAEELAEHFAIDLQAEKEVVLIPILRAGLAMLPPFMSHFPTAPVGFLGMFREEKTLKPKLYYKKFPPFHQNQKILILDPMLATGGSLELAIQLLSEEGILEPQIVAICFIASKMGVQAVMKKYPRVRIECAAIDEKLDSAGFILPGLGDFGDRFFGTFSAEEQ